MIIEKKTPRRLVSYGTNAEFIVNSNGSVSYNVSGTEKAGLSTGGNLQLDGTLQVDGTSVKNPVDSAGYYTGVGDDIRIYHDGSNSFIDNITGSIRTKVNHLNLSTFTSFGSVTVSTPSLNTFGTHFKPDGKKMYTSTSAGVVYQWSLSTAWDVTTASYDSVSLDVTTESNNTRSLRFSDDGTKLYITSTTLPDTVFQYTLTTSWDLSTASYASKSFAVNGQTSAPEGLAFSLDGTKMYACSSSAIFQYSLSTAWDVSTASYGSVTFSVANEITLFAGFVFNHDGTKLLAVDENTTGTDVHQYTLTTAWDVSTASYDSSSINVSAVVSELTDLYLSPDETHLFISALTKVYQWDSTEDNSFNIFGSFGINTESPAKEFHLGYGTARFDGSVIFIDTTDASVELFNYSPSARTLTIGASADNIATSIYGGVKNPLDSSGFYTGADDDFRIYHSGTHGFITASTGSVFIKGNTTNGEIFLDSYQDVKIRDKLDADVTLFNFATTGRTFTIGAAADTIATTHNGAMTVTGILQGDTYVKSPALYGVTNLAIYPNSATFNGTTTLYAGNAAAGAWVSAISIASGSDTPNITVNGITIGANTLDTTEWAFLDGQDQALLIASSPTFAGLTLNGAISRVDSSGYVQNFTGATNWGIYWNTTTNSYEFHSGGAVVAQIDIETGRTAIGGTFAARRALEVSGNIIINDANVPTNSWLLHLDGTNGLEFYHSIESTDAGWGLKATVSEAGDLKITSLTIGANTLTTTEWAFLDGLDQSLATTDAVTFNDLIIKNDANGAARAALITLRGNDFNVTDNDVVAQLNAQGTTTLLGGYFEIQAPSGLSGGQSAVVQRFSGNQTANATIMLYNRNDSGTINHNLYLGWSATQYLNGTTPTLTLGRIGTVTGNTTAYMTLQAPASGSTSATEVMRLYNTSINILAVDVNFANGTTYKVDSAGAATFASLIIDTWDLNGTLLTGGTADTTIRTRHIEGKGVADANVDDLHLNYSAIGKGVIIGDTGTDHPLTVYGIVTAASFKIGSNTLDTTEWAFLDGLDQALTQASLPTFAGLTLSGSSVTWTWASNGIATVSVGVGVSALNMGNNDIVGVNAFSINDPSAVSSLVEGIIIPTTSQGNVRINAEDSTNDLVIVGNNISDFDLVLRNAGAGSFHIDIEGNITVGGTVDGVDIATRDALLSTTITDLDGFPDELKNLTTAEIQQLENIGTEAISATEWGYLAALNQGLTQTSNVTFNKIVLDATFGRIDFTGITTNVDMSILSGDNENFSFGLNVYQDGTGWHSWNASYQGVLIDMRGHLTAPIFEVYFSSAAATPVFSSILKCEETLVTINADLKVTGNDIQSSSATAITLNGANVTIAGNLTVTGNDILSSSATAITLSGANVTIVGDLTITGNDILDSGGNVHITFTAGVGGLTALAGDLKVTGNDIQSSSATAITLSGANVTIVGDLTITGNDILDSGGNNHINFTAGAGGLTTIAGDLKISGNDIQDSGGNNHITFTAGVGGLTTIAGDLKVSGNDIMDSGGTAAITFNGSGAISLSLGASAVNEFSLDGTMAGNSDTAVPTEASVKQYVDASGFSGNFWLNGGSFDPATGGQVTDGVNVSSNTQDDIFCCTIPMPWRILTGDGTTYKYLKITSVNVVWFHSVANAGVYLDRFLMRAFSDAGAAVTCLDDTTNRGASASGYQSFAYTISTNNTLTTTNTHFNILIYCQTASAGSEWRLQGCNITYSYV